MLDMKRTFDELVERLAPDAESRDRILGNRIYQHVSDALAGSVEYSAMEKVYELCAAPELRADRRGHAARAARARLPGGAAAPARVPRQPGRAPADPSRLRRRPRRRALVPARHAPRAAADRAGHGRRLPRGHLGVPARVRGHVRWLPARARAHVRELLRAPSPRFVLVAGPEHRVGGAAPSASSTRLEGFRVELAGVVANRVRAVAGRAALPLGSTRVAPIARALREALAARADPDFPADAAAQAAIDGAAGYAALVRRDERALARARAHASRARGASGAPCRSSIATSTIWRLCHASDASCAAGSRRR